MMIPVHLPQEVRSIWGTARRPAPGSTNGYSKRLWQRILMSRTKIASVL